MAPWRAAVGEGATAWPWRYDVYAILRSDPMNQDRLEREDRERPAERQNGAIDPEAEIKLRGPGCARGARRKPADALECAVAAAIA
jgi:hypothetical protein